MSRVLPAFVVLRGAAVAGILVRAAATAAAAQPAAPTPITSAPPSSRELERLTGMEIRGLVPGRIDIVRLPLGTLEPHGMTVNGADSLAPGVP